MSTELMQLSHEEISPQENFPAVTLSPTAEWNALRTPVYSSPVIDATTKAVVGNVSFMLRHGPHTMYVTGVELSVQRKGYGVSLYRELQRLYPDYQLHSSDQMSAKTSPEQEKPNAVYLWEKLVRLGDAEEFEPGKFRMKAKQ